MLLLCSILCSNCCTNYSKASLSQGTLLLFRGKGVRLNFPPSHLVPREHNNLKASSFKNSNLQGRGYDFSLLPAAPILHLLSVICVCCAFFYPYRKYVLAFKFFFNDFQSFSHSNTSIFALLQSVIAVRQVPNQL